MFVEIDKSLKPVESRLFLCKPNFDTIGELHEAYGKRIKFSSSGIDELQFKLPYKIMKNNEYIDNPNIAKLRGHYLIRYEEGDTKEYFIINKPTNIADQGIETKNVSCFLLPYGFDRKIVRNYKATKKLYDSVGSDGILNDTLLTKTEWSVGYIDTEIAIKYRTFDVSEKSLLEFMYDLQEAFNALIIWDTANKQINFYKYEEVGQNKGLSIEHGKYLKSITEEPDFDNVTTRLYLYGQDGISVNKYNASGTDYVESFDYYIHPFERDVDKNIIQHSNYMSDELCHAILDYEELLTQKNGEFTTLIDDKETKEELLLQKQNELYTLQTELLIIEDQLVTANATGNPTSDLITQKNDKLAEIDAKQLEINTVESDITTINSQINQIKTDIAIENNFSQDLIVERNDYIREKVWSNEYIFDEKELLDEGKKQLSKINQPIINYQISMVDFLKVVECQRDWDKLKKYDIVTIRYPNFNIDIKAKIIEIDRDDDGNSINLTIANADDVKSGFIELKDMLKRVSTSSTRFDMSKYKYDQASEDTSEINNIINSTWDANKRKITAGINESVEFSRKGLTITNPDNPNDMLIAQSGILALSNDAGDTWKHAITPTHIVGEVIMGKLIAGVNLSIDASDENGQNTFTVDGGGVKIQGAALTIEGGDNGVELSPITGLTITRLDDKVKSTLNATDGIKIEKNIGTSTTPNWVDQFYVDTDGVINAEELITKKIKINDGTGNTLIDADTKTIDFTGFDVITGKEDVIKGINITDINGNPTFTVDTSGKVAISGDIIMSGGSISWDSVTKPTYTASDVGALSTDSPMLTHIGSNGIYTGTLSANQINAGTIDAQYISTNIGQVSDTLLIGSPTSTGTLLLGSSSDVESKIYGWSDLGEASIVYEATTHRFFGDLDFSLASRIEWGSNAPIAVLG